MLYMVSYEMIGEGKSPVLRSVQHIDRERIYRWIVFPGPILYRVGKEWLPDES